MSRTSGIEIVYQAAVEQSDLPQPVMEFQFHPVRKWLFDFAWPEIKFCVELEGGTTGSRGRHVRPAGFEEDCIKYNAAILLGWRLMRFTSAQVYNGTAFELTKEAFTKFYGWKGRDAEWLIVL